MQSSWRSPIFVLCASVLLGSAAVAGVYVLARSRDQARFEHSVATSHAAIQARLDAYLTMMRGTVGLFGASDLSVDRDDFHTYVTSLEIDATYPGIQAIGFAEHVTSDELPRFEERLQAEGGRPARVWPPGEREVYSVVMLVEPLDERNRAALGYDMFSEASRRAAMMKAAEHGRPVQSGKVQLVTEREGEGQAGVLVYLPVFERGTRALHGFVYGAFRADDLFAGIFSSAPPEVSFRVFDGAPGEGKLLHLSKGAAGPDVFTASRPLHFADRDWTVTYDSLPEFGRNAVFAWVPLAASMVVLGTLLLFLFARAEAKARVAAEANALRIAEAKAEAERERQRLRSLFNGAPAFIAVMRGPTLVYELSNPRNQAALGGREVLGKAVREAFPEKEAEGLVHLVEEVYRTGRASHFDELPIRLARPDGTSTDIKINVLYVPTHDASGAVDGVALFGFDVTALVDARNEAAALAAKLKESEAHYRHTVELNPQVPWTATPEGMISGFSERWLTLTGLTRESALGEGWMQVPHPDDREAMRAAWTKSISSGEPYDIEHRVRLADGSYRWMRSCAYARRDEAGKILGWYGTTEDIHARRANEELFRQLVDNMPGLAWTARPDGHVDYYNRRWFELTGTTMAEMQGWGWKAIHHPDLLGEVTARWDHSLKSGEPFEMEFPIRGADGQFRWFLTRIQPLFDGAGKLIRWVGTSTDIDGQRKVAAELRDAITSRDTFLSVASHELKTPLTPLLLKLNTLERSLQKGATGALLEKLPADVQMMRRQVHGLSELVEQLLDVSRISSGRPNLSPVEVDFAALLRELAARFEPEAEKAGCPLSLQVGPGLVGRWDRSRLEQVVANLLSNALKYGAGKPVRLEAAAVGRRLEFAVRDEGIGIPEEFRARMFGKFQRGVSERNFGGLGVGLYVSRELVTAMGGEIQVESAEGMGATFTVRLPLGESA